MRESRGEAESRDEIRKTSFPFKRASWTDVKAFKIVKVNQLANY